MRRFDWIFSFEVSNIIDGIDASVCATCSSDLNFLSRKCRQGFFKCTLNRCRVVLDLPTAEGAAII